MHGSLDRGFDRAFILLNREDQSHRLLIKETALIHSRSPHSILHLTPRGQFIRNAIAPQLCNSDFAYPQAIALLKNLMRLSGWRWNSQEA
jgi:hypothetical protein